MPLPYLNCLTSTGQRPCFFLTSTGVLVLSKPCILGNEIQNGQLAWVSSETNLCMCDSIRFGGVNIEATYSSMHHHHNLIDANFYLKGSRCFGEGKKMYVTLILLFLRSFNLSSNIFRATSKFVSFSC